MNRRNIIGLALAGAIATSAAVMAAVTFNPATGEGFVGKGDVQLVYGWNNKTLQDNANSVQFQYASDIEETWTCSRLTPNPNDPADTRQYQNRHLEQAISGAPDADPRQVKGQKQFTGFILKGYIGDPDIETDGQTLNSCPSGGDWTYDEGSNQITQTGGGLQVSIDGNTWFDLQ